MSTWIKITEQLPKEGQGVLLTDGSEWDVGFYRMARDHKTEDSKSPSWLFQGDGDYGSVIDVPTHWMPLTLPDEKEAQ